MRAVLALLFAAIVAFPVSQSGETDEILAQLSKIQLNKKQIYNIRDITIRRDAASISFKRGTIAFLEPVRGKVTGAVFIGSGEILAIPPNAIEKQQMHKFTNSPALDESFSAAFFRFTDDTYDEIVKAFEEHAKEDLTVEDSSQFLPWDKTLADRSSILNYRILADYIGEPKPLFFAELKGERSGWFDMVFDQRMVEEVGFIKVHDSGASYTADIWSSFNTRSEARDLQANANENKAPLDVTSYEIDATINATTQLEAKAVVHARPRLDGERVISMDLSRFLRVSSVTTGAGENVPFSQHADMTEEEIRRTGINTVVLVLPQRTKAGQDITLNFTYAGDVIETKGSGVFFVGERGRWYPNSGIEDRAKFNLTFHFPEKYSLVATGKKTKEWEENGLRHSTWESDREFPVAGFNLGDFTTLSDSTGPVAISVSVNNNVESVYREIAERRALQKQQAMNAAIAATAGRRGQPTLPTAPTIESDVNVFSTKALGENVLKGIADTVAFFAERFGPYPYSQLTVSQFPVNYSQGWPTLLYVSTLSFFTKEQRDKLGLNSEADFMRTEMVRAHEVAHQWFGNKVGWTSYHDQWISEAFANYSGAMYVEQKHKDGSPLREVLDDSRRRLLEHAPDGSPYDSVGPIWLGQRLSSSAVPDAYNEIVYNKGTWFVHMLRMLMRGDERNPDDGFLKMIREFLNEYDGKTASTWDLKRVAEKYMTKAMDIRGDKKLDWFFDDWILGTGIPTYSVNYRVQSSPRGFVVEGQISQTGVPDTFIMPVPVYADDVLLGRVTVSDDEGSFRFEVKTKPVKVTIDPQQTILAQIK